MKSLILIPPTELLAAIFDHLCDSVYLLDPETSNILWVNQEGCRALGMEREEILNHSVLTLQKNVIGQVQWRSIADVIRNQQNYTFIGSHVHKDGSEFPVEVNTSTFYQNENEYFLSIARDITKRRAAEARMIGQEQQLLTAINASSDGLWDWDMLTDYVYMSESWKKMLGYGSEELNNHVDTWKSSVHPDDIDYVFQALEEHLAGKRERYQAEYRLRNRNGHYLWVKDTGCISQFDENGHPIRVTGLVTDITDYKNIEKKLLTFASYDELTGLRNRRECTRMFNEYLNLAKRKSSSFSIAMFDLDFFKEVNDKYGHLAGDQVLKNVANQLIRMLRSSDFLFRWGGEEFLLICPDTTLEELHQLANKLRKNIKKIVTIFDDNKISITASFGLAAFPNQGQDQKGLLLIADSELYRAKSKGRDCICYKNK